MPPFLYLICTHNNGAGMHTRAVLALDLTCFANCVAVVVPSHLAFLHPDVLNRHIPDQPPVRQTKRRERSATTTTNDGNVSTLPFSLRDKLPRAVTQVFSLLNERYKE
jgi:hypothetical protein